MVWKMPHLFPSFATLCTEANKCISQNVKVFFFFLEMTGIQCLARDAGRIVLITKSLSEVTIEIR